MPKIKRWHPVSHDFNRDAQVIAMRKQFGDWSALAWLELLSIGDRNDGMIRGTLDEIAHILAPVSLQKYHERAANAARTLLERFTDNQWITVERDCIRIVKHAKYHRSQEPEPAPSEPDLTRPNHLKIKNQRQLDQKQVPIEPKKLDEKIKSIADKIYQLDRIRYQRLITWIKSAERSHSAEVIVASLEAYLPYAEKTENWWPYLTKLLEKTQALANANGTAAENDRMKHEAIPPLLQELMSGILKKEH